MSRSYASKYRVQRTPHSSPVRASYGASFVSFNSWKMFNHYSDWRCKQNAIFGEIWCLIRVQYLTTFVFVIVVHYAKTHNIGPRYGEICHIFFPFQNNLPLKSSWCLYNCEISCQHFLVQNKASDGIVTSVVTWRLGHISCTGITSVGLCDGGLIDIYTTGRIGLSLLPVLGAIYMYNVRQL